MGVHFLNVDIRAEGARKMTCKRISLLAWGGFALVAATVPGSKASADFAINRAVSSECVTTYDGSAGGRNCGSIMWPNIPNTCWDALGFTSTMATVPGVTVLPTFQDNAVWDTDTMESNLVSGGADTTFTDRPNSGVEYWSMHGLGGYSLGGFCTSDAQCAAGQRCFTLNSANHCVAFRQGQMQTCSTNDSFGGAVNLVTQVRLGESGFSGSWRGVGTNGNLNIAIFAISYPIEMHWVIESTINMFAGVHLVGGYAGYLGPWPSSTMGDVQDSATTGSHLATRLKNSQAAGNAHLDSTRLDEPTTIGAPSCTISVSCARNQSWSQWHLNSEQWPELDDNDETSSPTNCSWNYWCRWS